MTDLYAYDAAYKPNLAAVKAAGGIAINHYLTGTYASSSTHPAEALAAGLGSILTYEEGPSELVGATRATGQAVGRKILAAVQTLKIVPLDGSIAVYPSVDVNAPTNSCEQSFLGIRDVIDGKLSLRDYSEGAIIDDLAAHHITQGRAWLAAPTSWPGFNPGDPNVVMVQLVGTNVPGTDRNHLITDPHALGALWPAGSPYGDNMDLTPQNLTDIAKAVWGYQLHDVAADGVTATTANHPAFTWLTDNAHKDAVAAIADQVKNLAVATGSDPATIAQGIAAHLTLTAK